MGLLVDGVWQQDGVRTKDGQFIRPTTRFRNWVTPDGSAGPSGEGGFAAEAGRYHLYVSLACPWAHRTVIFRKLKGLENVISMSTVSPDMLQRRLDLQQGRGLERRRGQRQEQASAKSICSPIRNIPAASACRCCGTRSARRSSTTSCRKSSACSIRRSTPSPMSTPIIIREPLRAEIDRVNDLVYPNINNGVYRAGFATAQDGLRGGVPQRVRHARRDRADAVAAPLSRRQHASPRPTGGCSAR